MSRELGKKAAVSKPPFVTKQEQIVLKACVMLIVVTLRARGASQDKLLKFTQTHRDYDA